MRNELGTEIEVGLKMLAHHVANAGYTFARADSYAEERVRSARIEFEGGSYVAAMYARQLREQMREIEGELQSLDIHLEAYLRENFDSMAPHDSLLDTTEQLAALADQSETRDDD